MKVIKNKFPNKKYDIIIVLILILSGILGLVYEFAQSQIESPEIILEKPPELEYWKQIDFKHSGVGFFTPDQNEYQSGLVYSKDYYNLSISLTKSEDILNNVICNKRSLQNSLNPALNIAGENCISLAKDNQNIIENNAIYSESKIQNKEIRFYLIPYEEIHLVLHLTCLGQCSPDAIQELDSVINSVTKKDIFSTNKYLIPSNKLAIALSKDSIPQEFFGFKSNGHWKFITSTKSDKGGVSNEARKSLCDAKVFNYPVPIHQSDYNPCSVLINDTFASESGDGIKGKIRNWDQEFFFAYFPVNETIAIKVLSSAELTEDDLEILSFAKSIPGHIEHTPNKIFITFSVLVLTGSLMYLVYKHKMNTS